MADTGNRGFSSTGQQNRIGMPAGGNPGQHDEGGLAGVASAVKETAQNIASSVASTAGDAWDSSRQGVQQAASAVADTASDTWNDLTNFMRRYPFVTLFVGLGLGFCLSRFVEGRSMGTFGHWDFGHQSSDRGHDSFRSS